MARRNRRSLLLIGIGVVLLAWAIWMGVAEFAWRNPQAAGNQDAIVQPATTPPPGGVSPNSSPLTEGEPAGRGQSAVRGDGAPLNGSTDVPKT